MKAMKPFLQMAIIVVFAAAILIGISTSATAGRMRPQVTRNNNVMILEYDFDQPEVTTDGDFDYISISGLNRYAKPGEPVLPVKPVEILIPAGMKIVRITSTPIDPYQLPDTYRLSHGYKPRRKPSSGEKAEPAPLTQPNPAIFGMTKFWPIQQHDLVTVQTNRGYNIAHVNLFPLQYSPKPGKIKTATKMRLKIHLASTDSHRRAKPTKNLREKLGRNIDNPDTMESYDISLDLDEVALRKASPSDSLAGPYQYIVITDASLADYSGANNFQDLCNSKIARGISAGIVTTEWIYDQVEYDGVDNQTRIRNFLIDAYETWGTEYTLLGGNKDIIPVRTLNSDGTDIPADMYYGCVDPPVAFDGGDLTAEISIGRASVENSTDVANFVNKTLVYGSISDPYLDHALSGGGYLGFGGIADYNKPFSELIRIGSDLYTGHYTCGFVEPEPPNTRNFSNMRDFNVATLYDADGTWDATTDLVPILNGTDGNITPQIVYIADHGSTTWGMVKMSTTETSEPDCDTLLNLNNTRPFFFYDDSCDVGHFDSANCFSEVATTMEYGAFACITNSRSGWGGTAQNPLDSPTTQLTREFYHSFLGEGTFELGRAHADAKERCIWRISYTRYDIYQSTLFGDPELQLRVTSKAPSCAYTCGDQDGVGVNVDLVDFGLFASCWGKDPQIDPNCLCANLVELDRHIIDLFDLTVLAELFLTSSSDHPPNNCSTSITDPYPPSPNPMSFAIAPVATSSDTIVMTATPATDSSGVEYYFTCTAGGGNDSSWQDSRTYEDTGLSPTTEYTYTITARDKSIAHNQTAASDPASATTSHEDNVVLPTNGGVLESFTSEYGGGWFASDLTNGETDEDGWSSAHDPAPYQEFVYSFDDGKDATLDLAVIHGGTGEGQYFSKDVEVWTFDGTSFTLAGSNMLLARSNDLVTINLGSVVAEKVRLRITSGYRTDYWELAEFVVYGEVID